MLTCKLCGTQLGKKNLRRDGSLLCPICGQIYWKAAVERAYKSADDSEHRAEIRKLAYNRESRKSTEWMASRIQEALIA